MKDKQPEWEKEFDERLCQRGLDGKPEKDAQYPQAIKSFIKSLLAKRDQENYDKDQRRFQSMVTAERANAKRDRKALLEGLLMHNKYKGDGLQGSRDFLYGEAVQEQNKKIKELLKVI